MSQLCDRLYVNDTSELVAMLTYFNTWLALRGGWASTG